MSVHRIRRGAVAGAFSLSLALAAGAAHGSIPNTELHRLYYGDLFTPIDVGTDHFFSHIEETLDAHAAANGQSADGKGISLHAFATIKTKEGYASGTNGLMETSVIASTEYDILAPSSGADFGDIFGGHIVFHEKLEGKIVGGQDSSMFASTVIIYNDADGHQVLGQGFNHHSGLGDYKAFYDVAVPITTVADLHSLEGMLFDGLSLDARLDNRDSMPEAGVNALNTQAIMGFGIYDAAGKYMPGFTISGDFGTMPEYDTVLPTDTSGAPEPASWALMILGFGAAGAMLRRRHAGFA